MAFPPTDWLDWTTAEYEVGAPATSLSFERWFRNPVALAQGAAGAPKVSGIALDNVYIGFGAGTGGVGIPVIKTDLGRVKTLQMDVTVGCSATWNFQLGFSNDNGASWGSYQNLGPTGNGSGVKFLMRVIINLIAGVTSYTGIIGAGPGAANTTLSVPSGCNAILLYATGSDPAISCQFTVLAGRE